MSNRFLVFQSKTHSYLCCTLIILTLFIGYLSYQLDYVWMYAVSILFSIIVALTLSFLYAHITVSDHGIQLWYGFFLRYRLPWEDILCCGTFSFKIPGSQWEEEYIYFSKKPVSYRSLVTGRTLPAQSDTFLFMTKQNNALIQIRQYFPNFKG